MKKKVKFEVVIEIQFCEKKIHSYAPNQFIESTENWLVNQILRLRVDYSDGCYGKVTKVKEIG